MKIWKMERADFARVNHTSCSGMARFVSASVDRETIIAINTTNERDLEGTSEIVEPGKFVYS